MSEKRVEVFPYAHHIDKYFDLTRIAEISGACSRAG